jgi:hypothetical protein
MSQPEPNTPPQPPPLPPAGAPPAPVPPAQPSPQFPVAAMPLTYGNLPPPPVRRQRPELMTVVGGLSIAVACISFTANLVVGAMVLLFYFLPPAVPRVAPGPPGPAPVTRGGPATQPSPGPKVGPNGMTESDRQRVVDGLMRLRLLSSQRQEQLHAMLAEAGKIIFPAAPGAALSAKSVRGMVLAEGEMFSSAPGARYTEFFTTAAGRLELYDDRAVFYPADGSEAVRTAFKSSAEETGLTPADVVEALEQARKACKDAGTDLNQDQLATLEAALASPTQALITTPGPLPMAEWADALPGGAVRIRFRDAELTLGARGQVVPPAPGPPPRPAGEAVALLVAATLLAAAVAVYLLVAGVFALRRLPRAAALHRRYAVAQVLLTVLAAAGLWWMTGSYAASRAEAGLAAPTPAVPFGTQALLWVALGCAYPIFLFVALRSKPSDPVRAR